jgi:hypothetical protein
MMTLPYLKNMDHLAGKLDAWCVAVFALNQIEQAVDLSDEEFIRVASGTKGVCGENGDCGK